MQTIQCSQLRPTKRLVGKFLNAEHYDVVIDDDTQVLRPNGSLLLMYVREALPRPVCDQALAAFRDVPLDTDLRGTASGMARGTHVPSSTLGYLDRTGRIPYCRRTTLTRNYWSQFTRAGPFFQAASDVFRQVAPARWRAQHAFVATVPQEYVLPGTVFTTVQVNRSWPTAAHRDPGNFGGGFGVLAVLGGPFTGGELIFPRYGVAVDLRPGGALLADVAHALHGNAPLDVQPPAQRLSFVMYARARMAQCLPFADELRRAQQRSRGT